MKFPFLFADYSKKQKRISFFIGIGFSMLMILGIMIKSAVSGYKSFDDNIFYYIDDQIVDGFFNRRYRTATKELPVSRRTLLNVALIKIDEESLGTEQFPKWPIPRGQYAELLKKLKLGGAKTIGFDIILSEASVPEEDEKLREILSQMDNVFLPIEMYEATSKINPNEMESETDEMTSLSIKYPYKPFSDELKKTEEKKGESRFGFVSVIYEDVIRRIPLAVSIRGKPYYQLGVAMSAHYLDIPQKDLRYSDDMRYFLMGDRKIPLELEKMRINYLFPNERATTLIAGKPFNLRDFMNVFSIAEVFEMDDDSLRAAFDNKLVLVGVTASAGTDIKMTPFGRLPQLYAYANILFSILGQKYVSTAPAWVNLSVILLIGGLMGICIPRLSPLLGAVFTAFLCYGYYEYCYWSFVNKGIIHFITAPLLCACLSFVVINIYHLIAEIKAKTSISKMFREFAPMPSSLIEKYIEESGGSAAVGGKLAHVTVLFSDIRGYTDLSERMSSTEMMELLSKYHQEMGEIFKETGGVVFTYIGDAQLVVYGLEGISKKNHAAAAIKAGLMMQERLDKLAKELKEENKVMFEVGVGICTGELSIGVVGSSQLKQYTVIGDTVNVASRIQGMSRELGSNVLIHERTYLMAKHCIEAIPLRPVKLKGKREPVNVYGVKKVYDIVPYPKDEIKDLDIEVAELHRRRKEALQRLKDNSSKEDIDLKQKKEDITKRRRVKDDIIKRPDLDYQKDRTAGFLEPLEEKSKGEIADSQNEE